MNRFSWLGGRTSPKADAQSTARAGRHRKHATAVDRRGWRDHDAHDAHDRRLYGD